MAAAKILDSRVGSGAFDFMKAMLFIPFIGFHERRYCQ